MAITAECLGRRTWPEQARTRGRAAHRDNGVAHLGVPDILAHNSSVGKPAHVRTSPDVRRLGESGEGMHAKQD